MFQSFRFFILLHIYFLGYFTMFNIYFSFEYFLSFSCSLLNLKKRIFHFFSQEKKWYLQCLTYILFFFYLISKYIFFIVKILRQVLRKSYSFAFWKNVMGGQLRFFQKIKQFSFLSFIFNLGIYKWIVLKVQKWYQRSFQLILNLVNNGSLFSKIIFGHFYKTYHLMQDLRKFRQIKKKTFGFLFSLDEIWFGCCSIFIFSRSLLKTSSLVRLQDANISQFIETSYPLVGKQRTVLLEGVYANDGYFFWSITNEHGRLVFELLKKHNFIPNYLQPQSNSEISPHLSAIISWIQECKKNNQDALVENVLEEIYYAFHEHFRMTLFDELLQDPFVLFRLNLVTRDTSQLLQTPFHEYLLNTSFLERICQHWELVIVNNQTQLFSVATSPDQYYTFTKTGKQDMLQFLLQKQEGWWAKEWTLLLYQVYFELFVLLYFMGHPFGRLVGQQDVLRLNYMPYLHPLFSLPGMPIQETMAVPCFIVFGISCALFANYAINPTIELPITYEEWYWEVRVWCYDNLRVDPNEHGSEFLMFWLIWFYLIPHYYHHSIRQWRIRRFNIKYELDCFRLSSKIMRRRRSLYKEWPDVPSYEILTLEKRKSPITILEHMVKMRGRWRKRDRQFVRGYFWAIDTEATDWWYYSALRHWFYHVLTLGFSTYETDWIMGYAESELMDWRSHLKWEEKGTLVRYETFFRYYETLFTNRQNWENIILSKGSERMGSSDVARAYALRLHHFIFGGRWNYPEIKFFGAINFFADKQYLQDQVEYRKQIQFILKDTSFILEKEQLDFTKQKLMEELLNRAVKVKLIPQADLQYFKILVERNLPVDKEQSLMEELLMRAVNVNFISSEDLEYFRHMRNRYVNRYKEQAFLENVISRAIKVKLLKPEELTCVKALIYRYICPECPDFNPVSAVERSNSLPVTPMLNPENYQSIDKQPKIERFNFFNLKHIFAKAKSKSLKRLDFLKAFYHSERDLYFHSENIKKARNSWVLKQHEPTILVRLRKTTKHYNYIILKWPQLLWRYIRTNYLPELKIFHRFKDFTRQTRTKFFLSREPAIENTFQLASLNGAKRRHSKKLIIAFNNQEWVKLYEKFQYHFYNISYSKVISEKQKIEDFLLFQKEFSGYYGDFPKKTVDVLEGSTETMHPVKTPFLPTVVDIINEDLAIGMLTAFHERSFIEDYTTNLYRAKLQEWYLLDHNPLDLRVAELLCRSGEYDGLSEGAIPSLLHYADVRQSPNTILVTETQLTEDARVYVTPVLQQLWRQGERLKYSNLLNILDRELITSLFTPIRYSSVPGMLPYYYQGGTFWPDKSLGISSMYRPAFTHLLPLKRKLLTISSTLGLLQAKTAPALPYQSSTFDYFHLNLTRQGAIATGYYDFFGNGPFKMRPFSMRHWIRLPEDMHEYFASDRDRFRFYANRNLGFMRDQLERFEVLDKRYWQTHLPLFTNKNLLQEKRWQYWKKFHSTYFSKHRLHYDMMKYNWGLKDPRWACFFHNKKTFINRPYIHGSTFLNFFDAIKHVTDPQVKINIISELIQTYELNSSSHLWYDYFLNDLVHTLAEDIPELDLEHIEFCLPGEFISPQHLINWIRAVETYFTEGITKRKLVGILKTLTNGREFPSISPWGYLTPNGGVRPGELLPLSTSRHKQLKYNADLKEIRAKFDLEGLSTSKRTKNIPYWEGALPTAGELSHEIYDKILCFGDLYNVWAEDVPYIKYRLDYFANFVVLDFLRNIQHKEFWVTPLMNRKHMGWELTTKPIWITVPETNVWNQFQRLLHAHYKRITGYFTVSETVLQYITDITTPFYPGHFALGYLRSTRVADEDSSWKDLLLTLDKQNKGPKYQNTMVEPYQNLVNKYLMYKKDHEEDIEETVILQETPEECPDILVFKHKFERERARVERRLERRFLEIRQLEPAILFRTPLLRAYREEQESLYFMRMLVKNSNFVAKNRNLANEIVETCLIPGLTELTKTGLLTSEYLPILPPSTMLSSYYDYLQTLVFPIYMEREKIRQHITTDAVQEIQRVKKEYAGYYYHETREDLLEPLENALEDIRRESEQTFFRPPITSSSIWKAQVMHDWFFFQQGITQSDSFENLLQQTPQQNGLENWNFNSKRHYNFYQHLVLEDGLEFIHKSQPRETQDEFRYNTFRPGTVTLATKDAADPDFWSKGLTFTPNAVKGVFWNQNRTPFRFKPTEHVTIFARGNLMLDHNSVQVSYGINQNVGARDNWYWYPESALGLLVSVYEIETPRELLDWYARPEYSFPHHRTKRRLAHVKDQYLLAGLYNILQPAPTTLQLVTQASNMMTPIDLFGLQCEITKGLIPLQWYDIYDPITETLTRQVPAFYFSFKQGHYLQRYYGFYTAKDMQKRLHNEFGTHDRLENLMSGFIELETLVGTEYALNQFFKTYFGIIPQNILEFFLYSTYWGHNWLQAIYQGSFIDSHIEQLNLISARDGLLDFVNQDEADYKYHLLQKDYVLRQEYKKQLESVDITPILNAILKEIEDYTIPRQLFPSLFADEIKKL